MQQHQQPQRQRQQEQQRQLQQRKDTERIASPVQSAAPQLRSTASHHGGDVGGSLPASAGARTQEQGAPVSQAQSRTAQPADSDVGSWRAAEEPWLLDAYDLEVVDCAAEGLYAYGGCISVWHLSCV